MKPSKDKKEDLRDELIRLYWEEELPLSEVSKRTEIDIVSLYYLFVRQGIKLRSKRQAMRIYYKKQRRKKRWGKSQ